MSYKRQGRLSQQTENSTGTACAKCRSSPAPSHRRQLPGRKKNIVRHKPAIVLGVRRDLPELRPSEGFLLNPFIKLHLILMSHNWSEYY